MSENDGLLPPLLRMIAHDLKGLLGTPGLLLDLAGSSRDESELRERLVALRESFRALDRAVSDVGDLGLSVGAPPSPGSQPSDLRTVIESVVHVARPAALPRNIELVPEIAPGPWPPVLGETMLLTRTIERLVFWGIGNAASNSRFVLRARVEDGAVVLTVPTGRSAAAAVPTVRERLAELTAGTRELGITLPLAREALERSGGTLVLHDGTLEARIPTKS